MDLHHLRILLRKASIPTNPRIEDLCSAQKKYIVMCILQIVRMAWPSKNQGAER